MIEQFGVLPYRVKGNGGVEILLITSRDTGRWVTPKGNPMAGRAGHEAAVVEAYEEAGVEGLISPVPLGRFVYDKRRPPGDSVEARVTLYPLQVTRQHPDWPERGERTTRWFEPGEAEAAVHEPGLKALLRGFAAGEAALRQMIEALNEPALIVDAGAIRLANAAARALLGPSVEGDEVRRAFRHPAALERLLAEGAGAEGEAELLGLGETDRRWRMSVARLGGGAILVRLADRSEAQAAEQMRVNFVANASHELRTPLATLVGYAETMRERREEVDETTRTRFITIIHDEALRMQRLVEDLISLSRIEAERFSAPTDALALPELVAEARSNLSAAALERNSEIRIEAQADLPAVAGDRSQILQMIDNLLANALRYGRAGTPVTVRVDQAGKMVRLVVADQGEGIAPEHIPRITERFYRADPSRSRSLGGTGLGLAIVKHIVERHRGELAIESEVGAGTSVRVLLPAWAGSALS